MDSNPKTFCNLINKLSSFSAKSVGENIQEFKFIDLKKTNTHKTTNNDFHAKVISDFHAMETQYIESSTTDSDLSIKEIDTAEIMKAIKGLKTAKMHLGTILLMKC